MMKRSFFLLFWFVLGLFQVGCQMTGWEQQRQQDARLASDVSALRISLQRLEYRLADMTQEQEVLGRDVQALRVSLHQVATRSDAGLSGLSARIDEQANSQVMMRRALTDELSTRMATILRDHARTAGASRPPVSGRGAEVGYEHEVQSGETLSEIARAYGVAAQDILQANQLRDPNMLRVGQKLFIPAR